MKTITGPELAAWLADADRPAPVLLDVRERWEHELCRIAGSRLVPMGEIAAQVASLDSAQPLVCICHHGARSAQVAGFLERAGFSGVFNLTGGIDAWARGVDASMPTY